jgi:hypothetical protein
VIDAHFGLLKEKASLNIYDLGLTTLDPLTPTGIVHAIDLDSRATAVQRKLKEAMFHWFLKWYHPVHTYNVKHNENTAISLTLLTCKLHSTLHCRMAGCFMREFFL